MAPGAVAPADDDEERVVMAKVASASLSGDTTPCRMTGVSLHGVVSPECCSLAWRRRSHHGSQSHPGGYST